METVRQRRMGTPGTGLLPPSTVSSEDIDVAWELARLGELHCVPEASTSSAEWHESLDSDAAAQDATIGAVSRTSSMFSRRTTANPSPQAKAHRATPCPHGKARSYYCRDCGGAGICPHGRIRSRCKECGGSAFCEHGTRRARCKQCKGASICEHLQRRSRCKLCGGSSICIHGRMKFSCKLCTAPCDHGYKRSQCPKCRTTSPTNARQRAVAAHHGQVTLSEAIMLRQ
ncbi:hypothetical protein PBRA_006720 [Plasmodiophora brassicae]|nr:hypothetical protein PBRA_006720 [Plasmodiophora brassicae]